MLGALWTILNPLAMILIYTLIFSQIMRTRLPGTDSTFAYSIYLCAGVLTWGFFAEIIGRGQNLFLEHANLLKKIAFPRLLLPIILILNAGLNFVIVFGLFSLFLVVSGNFPGLVYFAIFPILCIQILFSISLAVIIGTLNVFFRDVGQFFGIFMQFWFWLTPIVYPISIIPERAHFLINWNPMMPLVSAYQNILISGQMPHWRNFLPITLLTLLLCWLGLRLFRKRSGEIVDEL